jgi:hypothetical protein
MCRNRCATTLQWSISAKSRHAQCATSNKRVGFLGYKCACDFCTHTYLLNVSILKCLYNENVFLLVDECCACVLASVGIKRYRKIQVHSTKARERNGVERDYRCTTRGWSICLVEWLDVGLAYRPLSIRSGVYSQRLTSWSTYGAARCKSATGGCSSTSSTSRRTTVIVLLLNGTAGVFVVVFVVVVVVVTIVVVVGMYIASAQSWR